MLSTCFMLSLLGAHMTAAALIPSAVRHGTPLSSRRTAARLPELRCGFEVESVDEKGVGEMGVMGWPGLEKRTNDFSLTASADEVLMVYVKEGSARLTEGDESSAVTSGQMVMISDGNVAWSDVSEGGLTLISTTAPLADVTEEEDDGGSEATALDEPKDLTLKEAAILLGAGLISGGLLSFGVKMVNS
mmetsp:Transcript_53482/g.106416  ORF Transcript_53482/g.106416 Transcript_53482/m.106416 type:complete len:189 (-) Transcript_53482:211-777(-)|eukprot:CAMPEP_0174730118 /NCGR_PEP_ID=MMETSP1094-20130205/54966_1 /TAXON_ID=156173 /ORGANISM="Chrysochromulina brevifilum, Strain UTEX LB 985" /LENGTH=188 /DNA_ID=CAMNT_0015932329 /DNA_START=73 /DNA_END=639 /DNA_ORIENTATION=+